MSNSEFIKEWTRLKDKVLTPPQMSVAEKVLAYKLFLRPILVHSWLDNNSIDLKSLEVKAMREIFGNISVSSLYEKFTDCDICTFVQVEQIRWTRATKGAPHYVCSVLKISSRNPTRYFNTTTQVSKSIRKTVRNRNKRKCSCNLEAEAGTSKAKPTIKNNSSSETSFKGKSIMNLTKSEAHTSTDTRRKTKVPKTNVKHIYLNQYLR